VRKRSQAFEREKTREEKAYLQGWRAGLKRAGTKDGPANHRVASVREAYLQGYEHGEADIDVAEQHALQHWGPGRD
jgi:hypothetical protein